MPKQTCIVLAGGLGTRLRSAVADLPKCLAPVGERSFLDIQFDTLFAAGIDDIVLSLGHQSQLVIDAVSSRSATQPIRHVVEPALLGTGGAIAFALDALGLDEALVANGDTHLTGSVAGMLPPLDRARGELLRMALVTVPDRGRFGGVEADADGRVQRFVEKGHHGPGAINAGLYRLCRAALPAAREGAGPAQAAPGAAYSLEADVLPSLVARGAVRALPIDGQFTDIGVPEDYFRFVAEHAR